MKTSTRLRKALAEDGAVVAPGAFDGLSARLIELAGFPAVYASGGAIARSTGVPDLGLLSMAEVVDKLETMVDAVNLPIIADADTGYGNALNAQRAMKAFQRAGVAGFHIEDQVYPKRCGHYDDKAIVSTAEMQQKIRALLDVREDSDFIVIARTDALAVEGFEAAIDRAHAYMDAGADVIFVEAPQSVEEIEKIADVLPYRKLINMFHGGKTPMMETSRLAELGYKIVIIPSDLQRAALGAMMDVLQAIKRDGHSGELQDRMVSFQDREKIVATGEFLKRDSQYAA